MTKETITCNVRCATAGAAALGMIDGLKLRWEHLEGKTDLEILEIVTEATEFAFGWHFDAED